MSPAEIFGIYAHNFVAVLLSSVVLALAGAQLAARSESLHAFVASQSASLGVTLGLAVLILFGHGAHEISSFPALSALVCAAIFYLVGQKLSASYRAKSAEILISLFLLSLALNFLVTASLPQLETHFSSMFMGDIATATSASSLWLAALSFVTGTFCLMFLRKITFQSFWATSGVSVSTGLRKLFYIACALLIVESTRIFGFLYTAASLIVVPLAVSVTAKSFWAFHRQSMGLAVTSSGLGFVMSLYSTKLSTSASIVATQVLLCGAWVIGLKWRERKFR